MSSRIAHAIAGPCVDRWMRGVAPRAPEPSLGPTARVNREFQAWTNGPRAFARSCRRFSNRGIRCSCGRWGPSLTQIFNDGHLPSFGSSGRDQTALGAAGLAIRRHRDALRAPRPRRCDAETLFHARVSGDHGARRRTVRDLRPRRGRHRVRARSRRGRTRQPREGRVPRRHEPRAADATRASFRRSSSRSCRPTRSARAREKALPWASPSAGASRAGCRVISR